MSNISSSLSSSFSAGLSGIRAATKRLDAVADNLANMDNVVPTSQLAFQERTITTAPVAGTLPGGAGGGVAVTGVALGSAQGRLAYDPSNPIADGQGMVRQPEVSVSEQMVQMRLSTLEVKANVRTIEAARDIYESVLEIGRS
ncbi:MAG: flagellar basal-body rod protein FlgC [Actinomycetota bacterium]